MTVDAVKIKFSRVEKGFALRTSSVEGVANFPPVIGESFLVTAEPLDPLAAVRVVSTSPVVDILWTESGCLISTMTGSWYQLEKM